MELPTLREETCKKKVTHFRRMMAKSVLLSTEQRHRLLDEMQIFCDSLSTGNQVLGAAGIGLSAAILPVLGAITGPVIGGIYGAYKSRKLAHYRDEVLGMIRELAS